MYHQNTKFLPGSSMTECASCSENDEPATSSPSYLPPSPPLLPPHPASLPALLLPPDSVAVEGGGDETLRLTDESLSVKLRVALCV